MPVERYTHAGPLQDTRASGNRQMFGRKDASRFVGGFMGLLDRRTISVLLTILMVAGVLALLWAARRPVIAFIFAIFFAHLLEPVVGRFQRWLGLSRVKAVAVTYLAILVGLLIFGLTVGPQIIQQGQRMPDLLQQVKSGNTVWQVGEQQRWSDATDARIQR